MGRHWRVVGTVLGLFLMRAVGAGELNVLSAGAIEPGVKAVVASFRQDTGHAVKLTFNTAPQIRQRIGQGEPWDVVLAPPAVMEELARNGKVGAERVSVGRVGLGVAVRPDAPLPDISSSDALKRSVMDAESLVFNRASTGLYFEGLLRKMGIYPQLEARATRYADGASVMEHLLRGRGKEIGVGPITEILLYRDKGLRLVGPLPAEVQNYTQYNASVTTTTANPGPARTLVSYLGSPAGQAFFVAAGIEP